MPANEQTWRSPKLLHLVFAVSSVLMLITTVWMMADDHNRPWKEFQRTFTDLDVRNTEWRAQEQQTADYLHKLDDLSASFADAQQTFSGADLQQVREFTATAAKLDEDFLALAKSQGRKFSSAYEESLGSEINSKAKGLLGGPDPKAVRALREQLKNQPKTDNPEAQKQTDKLQEQEKELKRITAGRAELFDLMEKLLKPFRLREDILTREVKDAKAVFAEKQSNFDQAVGYDAGKEKRAALQKAANDATEEVKKSTLLMQATVEGRKSLEGIKKQVTNAEDVAKKSLADHQTNVNQLNKTAKDNSQNVGKSILEMPILDAFNSPLKPANRWLPQLPWNNNFRDVARFDRCETCHLGMEKTATGAPTVGGFPPISNVKVSLRTPDIAAIKKGPKKPAEATATDAAGQSAPNETEAEKVKRIFGLGIAEEGIFNPTDVTIAAVYPTINVAPAEAEKLGFGKNGLSGEPDKSGKPREKVAIPSPAAVAGLQGGDVIEAINGAKAPNPGQAQGMFLDPTNWGKPLVVSVRRGVPQPFTSHPRLDLYVGSLSPHPVAKFGCSICHQGQGSATAFKWASHTPNSIRQGEEWARQYGWFNNENWFFPMYSHRFEQSVCLKCHHEVVELEPSREHPDPPAPKLVDGYETIRRYGCFGCHEINGFDGPNRRVGPDLRTEPNYSAAASQLLFEKAALAKVNPSAVAWASELVMQPDNDSIRHRLLEAVSADAKLEKPLIPGAKRLEGVLKDVDTPGTQRKVGPSLRHVASKLSYEFLASWIANPQDFRPGTRMPRFFGQWNHLDGPDLAEVQKSGIPEAQYSGLAVAQMFEPVEIRAVSEFLLKNSQPFDYIEPPAGALDEPSNDKDRADALARGKKSFATRGCLACHAHADFPKTGMAVWDPLTAKTPEVLKSQDFPNSKATQGPDLSRIGAKLALSGANGRKWLYSWIRNPSRYHSRTFMPNLFLDPEKDLSGKSTGVDPAADVVAYLMNSQQGWKPTNVTPRQMSTADEKALEELALQWLSDKFPTERAEQYLKTGIPMSQADVVIGDEAVLLADQAGQSSTKEKESPEQHQQRIGRLMDYVGRRTVSKFGCFGCHDIPGYEDSKPIGTTLADWGKKLPARLAFEQIGEYVTHYPKGLHPSGVGADAKGEAEKSAAASGTADSEKVAKDDPARVEDFNINVLPESISYFMEKLLGEEREGFLWQKLREPRSYDFRKTENKKYNDRLRMPKFTFATETDENQDKIEAVMTFVLGLTADPPPSAFVYHPDQKKEAIVSGRKVLENFNCQGCHILEMERWDISFKPGALGPVKKPDDYSYVLGHYTPEQIAASQAPDRAGNRHATLFGMPKVDLSGRPLIDMDRKDADDNSLPPACTMLSFAPALTDGEVRNVDNVGIDVPLEAIAKRYPARGGELARFALPLVLVGQNDYKEKPNEAWGWLPPPLIGEGLKVQSQWLHDFLLDPFQIRPAAVLRMPKFNMSSAEASKLVNYFAAMDGAEYPYEFDPRTTSEHLDSLEASHDGKYLEGAVGIVTDNNYCIKCHLVGDFAPAGSMRAMGPRLDRVHNRLRPDYALRWLADPVRILPYTGMPQNIPPNKPIDQKLFKGASQEQLDALVDLLMNFDHFAQNQLSIKSRVKSAAPAAAATTSAAAPSGKTDEN